MRRFAWLVTILSLAATAAAAFYSAERLSINSSTADMFSADLPFRQREREIDQAFPQDRDTLVVVVDGDTPDLADDGANRLVARLRQQPDLFPSIFDLQASPHFRRNGLLYLSEAEIAQLTDRLAEAQPFLGALWRDPTLRGLFEMLALAAEHATTGDDGPAIEIDRVFDAVADVAEAQAGGRQSWLSWTDLMRAEDEKPLGPRLFVVQVLQDYSSLRPSEGAIEALRSAARALSLDESHGVRVRLTGSEALNDEELQSVSIGTGSAAALSLAMVGGLLFSCFRSLRLSLVSWITLFAGLIWTAGFAAVAVGQLNLISVAFSVLFIGLAIDFSIHYALRYREARETTGDHGVALRSTARSVGGGIALAGAAAAIGFYSFLPTAYQGLAELGLIAGSGMIIAVFASFTLLPALLTILPPRLRRPIPGEPPAHLVVAEWIRSHHRPILAGAALIGLAAVAHAPLTRFDFDPLNLKDPESESVSTFLELITNDPTRAYSITVLASNLDEAAAVGERIGALASVDSTRTLMDFVPDHQEAKLELIDTLALLLEPSLTSPPLPAPATGELDAAYVRLQEQLRLLAKDGATTTARTAERLAAALSAVIEPEGIESGAVDDLATRLLAGLPGRLQALREMLQAEAVTLDSLPAELRDRWIAEDGRARIEIYPKEDLHASPAALRRFVETVQQVAGEHVSGTPVTISEAGKAVRRAFAEAAIIAITGIVLLLRFVLGNFRDALLVFVPVILAGLLTTMATTVLDVPFNFANLIVLPLLFGLGVAGSLHLFLREKKETYDDVMGSSTPRAVLFSALTTVASFGSLALSQHPGTSGMGVLLTISIGLSLLCTMIVLPALMVGVKTQRRLRPTADETDSG
jgi:hypothetical protein